MINLCAVEYHPFSDQEWRMRGAGLGFGAKAAETGQLSEDNNLSENERFGVLRWGDGTVNLGHYLAVLATEYALLIQNEQTIQANRTLEELFLALQAHCNLMVFRDGLSEKMLTALFGKNLMILKSMEQLVIIPREIGKLFLSMITITPIKHFKNN